MSELVLSLPNDPGLRETLGDLPGVDVVMWDIDGPAPRPRIDIVVPPYWGGARRLSRLAHIECQLLQWQSIGYNGLDRYVPEGLPVANAATVHETSTAELALALTLAAQRGLPRFVRDGLEHRWELESYPSLADREVLLIGYGGVGKAIEARLSGFEVSLTRVARSAREETNLAGETVRVHALAELDTLLPQAEVLILAVPLTDETEGLIDADKLALLPSDALVVNVARGKVVVTDDLVAELSTGRLRAALDVTYPEPLPSDHPLWDLPGALITPHAGGDSSAMLPRMTALIRRQVEHLLAGESPENLVLGDWKAD